MYHPFSPSAHKGPEARPTFPSHLIRCHQTLPRHPADCASLASHAATPLPPPSPHGRTSFFLLDKDLPHWRARLRFHQTVGPFTSTAGAATPPDPSTPPGDGASPGRGRRRAPATGYAGRARVGRRRHVGALTFPAEAASPPDLSLQLATGPVAGHRVIAYRPPAPSHLCGYGCNYFVFKILRATHKQSSA
uniref:Uncharacterized protein n=1 Tax=Leersia perrieri TaxID=77586 RepID=A0A0D9WRQ7_9ORYZ